MITIGTGNDAGSDGLGRARDAGGKKLWTQDASAQPFGVIRHGGGLTISAGIPKLGGGWAVYTFTDDYPFTIYVGAVITADVLLIGGGGSGGWTGGNSPQPQAGGGGGGGFVDKHGAIIYSHEHTPPHDTAFPDGDVLVGQGGTCDNYPETSQGGDSKLGPNLTAYGGGYGGSSGMGVPASNGGSGGGSGGHEILSPDLFNGSVQQWNGVAGQGMCRDITPDGADPKDWEQGHDGGPGHDTAAWYDHSGAGGGGANWPANGYGYGAHGGMGRPCDIAGRDQTRGALGEAGFFICPWYSGGGGGFQRPNNWSYPSGEDGFGNAAGHGGFGAACAGQNGLVVVRVPLVYKQWITSPMQLTDSHGRPIFDKVWDSWLEEYYDVARMPAGVSYHELPPEQIHTDEMGDEIVTYWAWPPDHFHHWGFENI